jgi:hypothetical protein
MARAQLGGTRRLSGDVIISKVSGEAVKVSGETLQLASGTGPISVSGQPIRVSGETLALASGTGPILAKVSGESVTTKISGETVVAETSGKLFVGRYYPTPPTVGSGAVTEVITDSLGRIHLASGTGPISVSGQPVRVSGETVIAKVSGEVVRVSGEAVMISGQVVDLKTPTAIKTSGLFLVTAASGGASLPSGAIVSVTVKALSTNSGNIFVGGSTHLPYSGFGFLLEAGEAVNLDVDNFGNVWVCATVSGDKVTYLGIA